MFTQLETGSEPHPGPAQSGTSVTIMDKATRARADIASRDWTAAPAAGHNHGGGAQTEIAASSGETVLSPERR